MLIPTLLFFALYQYSQAQDDSLPSLISQQDVIHSIIEGQEVVLPCKFDKAVGDYGIVWRKSYPDDDNVLFAERSRITDDERLSYVNVDDQADWSIKIQQVRSSDAGTYECTLSSDPVKILKQKLEVQSKPIVNIFPEKSPQILAAGSSLTLTCQAIGNPTPTITWSRAEGGLPPTDSSKPGQLFFKSVSEQHSGTYECTADNAVLSPAHAKVQVRVISTGGGVDYEPKVAIDRKLIPAAISQSFNITCSYKSKPAPMVEWFIGGYKIQMPLTEVQSVLIDAHSSKCISIEEDLRFYEG